MYAVDGGNLENIRVLLQAGADPNICPDEDATPPAVFYAMPSDNIEALDLLYQYGTDINLIPKSQGHSAIMYATQYNAKDCVVGLLAKGALLHQRGNEGASVVTMAATNASVELMEILTQANIRGLPMDDVHIQQYWKKFQERDSEYTGQKAPVEVERAAFQALLDSIQVEGDSGDDEHDEQYVDAQQQFNS
jgi:ankyrin repeat protein